MYEVEIKSDIGKIFLFNLNNVKVYILFVGMKM